MRGLVEEQKLFHTYMDTITMVSYRDEEHGSWSENKKNYSLESRAD